MFSINDSNAASNTRIAQRRVPRDQSSVAVLLLLGGYSVSGRGGVVLVGTAAVYSVPTRGGSIGGPEWYRLTPAYPIRFKEKTNKQKNYCV